MPVTLSHSTIRFLEAVNDQWGAGWLRALTGLIVEGSITELDGEACIVNSEAGLYTRGQTWQQTRTETEKQLNLW